MAPQSFADEGELVAALRRGEESAFETLLEQHHGGLVRLAMLYVPSQAEAEEVVQETWLGVLRGLDRFEGRASLKTWIFRILTNLAKTRGRRESRSVPFSALGDEASEPAEPAVAPGRFRPPSAAELPGHWASLPAAWDSIPEQTLLSRETLAQIRRAIDALPPGQRAVISLRDVEGWSSAEVCNTLEISETNQRVLLHRARSRVRRALEAYLSEEEAE